MIDDEEYEDELANTLKELKAYYQSKMQQLDSWIGSVEAMIIENSGVHLEKGVEETSNFFNGIKTEERTDLNFSDDFSSSGNKKYPK